MIHKQTQDYFIQPKADVQNVIILDRDFSLQPAYSTRQPFVLWQC